MENTRHRKRHTKSKGWKTEDQIITFASIYAFPALRFGPPFSRSCTVSWSVTGIFLLMPAIDHESQKEVKEAEEWGQN